MLRLAPGFLGPPLLLIPAGFADGFVQGALWTAALAVLYGGAYVRGVSGFRIHPGHFAERHGLMIIIALGESILAIGVGASGVAMGPMVVLAAVLGIALVAALWWAYFDLVVLTAERRLKEARGEERARLALDSYAYLHLPMVAGIVVAAFGVEETLAHVGDPLGTIPAVALCGGVALYLLGHNAFRLREEGSVSVPRLGVAVWCVWGSSPWGLRPPRSSPSPCWRWCCVLWRRSRRRALGSFGASSEHDRSRGTRPIHPSSCKKLSDKSLEHP